MNATYTHRDVEIYRAKQDVNGNPRWIVWFLAFDNLEPERIEGESLNVHFDRWLGNVAGALKGGARRYRGRDFGGGVVWQSYDPKADVDRALDVPVLEVNWVGGTDDAYNASWSVRTYSGEEVAGGSFEATEDEWDSMDALDLALAAAGWSRGDRFEKGGDLELFRVESVRA